MKKTLIIVSFLAVLVVPSITFAAWYNPFSWFQKAPTSITVPVETTSVAVEASSTPAALPVSKPVITNTITVTDPKLQSQINELAKNNTDLQIQLAALTTKYNVLVAENASLVIQIKSFQNASTISVTPEKPTVSVSVRDGVSQRTLKGYIYSFPVSITNKGKEPVSIDTIDYNVYSNATQTNISSPFDLSNPVPVDGVSAFKLLNTVTIQGGQTVTSININVWYIPIPSPSNITPQAPDIEIRGLLNNGQIVSTQ